MATAPSRLACVDERERSPKPDYKCNEPKFLAVNIWGARGEGNEMVEPLGAQEWLVEVTDRRESESDVRRGVDRAAFVD